MTAGGSVLLVDDEANWRKIYEDGIRKLGIDSICAVSNLVEAGQAIDSKQFAAAVVDIGLNTSDETNVDGLQVMDKIRSVGDDTSIIVITGRSGGDVIDVVSDSFQKYGAIATFAKGKITSQLLRAAVEKGLRIYDDRMKGRRIPAYQALPHEESQMIWDEMMMRVLGMTGGARLFYDFLETLMGRYLPVVGKCHDKAIGSDLADGVAHGAFWSRAIGRAVVVSLGEQHAVDGATVRASSDGRLHGRYQIGELLNEYTIGGSKGVVFALRDCVRSEFDIAAS